jgi:hypothetical protein
VARRPIPRHNRLAPTNDVAAAPDRDTVRIAIGVLRADTITMGVIMAPVATAPSPEDWSSHWGRAKKAAKNTVHAAAKRADTDNSGP